MAKGGFWAFLGGLGAAMWREGTKQRRHLEENYRRESAQAHQSMLRAAEYDAT